MEKIVSNATAGRSCGQRKGGIESVALLSGSQKLVLSTGQKKRRASRLGRRIWSPFAMDPLELEGVVRTWKQDTQSDRLGSALTGFDGHVRAHTRRGRTVVNEQKLEDDEDPRDEVALEEPPLIRHHERQLAEHRHAKAALEHPVHPEEAQQLHERVEQDVGHHVV